jgi:hypothetical protein
MKKRIWIVVIVLAILLLVLFSVFQYYRHVSMDRIYAMYDQSTITTNSSKEQKDDILSNCSKFMQLRFPPSTELLYAVPLKGDFPDPSVCSVKLQLDRDDIQSFVGEIQKHNQIDGHCVTMGENRLTKLNIFRQVGSRNVWQPQKVQNAVFYSVTYNTEFGVPCLFILVDLDRSDIAIVYLYRAEF